MRIALRIIAAFIAVAVAFTLWFAIWFSSSGRMPLLLRGDMIGSLTILGWLLTLLVGPYAVVQLWRLRSRGRYAAATLVGFAVVYYVIGGIWLREPNAPATPIVAAGTVNLALLLVLLSGPARRACS